MFPTMLERREGGAPPPLITLASSRLDVASYLGLSFDAVNRATASRRNQRTIAFVDRNTVRIVNRKRFDRLVADV
jgi:CRP-like cAMP-binding protein